MSSTQRNLSDSPVYYNNLSPPPRTPHPALGSSPALHSYHLLTYYSVCVFILLIVDCLGSAPLGSVIDISNSVCPKLNQFPHSNHHKTRSTYSLSRGQEALSLIHSYILSAENKSGHLINSNICCWAASIVRRVSVADHVFLWLLNSLYPPCLFASLAKCSITRD